MPFPIPRSWDYILEREHKVLYLERFVTVTSNGGHVRHVPTYSILHLLNEFFFQRKRLFNFYITYLLYVHFFFHASLIDVIDTIGFTIPIAFADKDYTDEHLV